MKQRLLLAWRTCASGISFVGFGVGGLAFTGLVVPICSLAPGDTKQKQARVRRKVKTAFGFFMAMMQKLGLIHPHVEGLADPEETRGRLIVANHPSLIDIVYLLSLLPDAVCVVKMGVWNNPFFRATVRGAGYIPNDGPKAIIQAAADHLRDGRTVVLFPEGTRSPPGGQLPFRRGAAWMAIEAKCDIYPVWITTKPSILTKGLPWYRIPAKGCTFVLHFLPVFPTRKVVEQAHSTSMAARELTRQLEQMYHDLLADMRP